VAYKYDENMLRVNIVDMLQEKADSVPPSQWRTFLLEPEKCEVGGTMYRKRLPRYDEGVLNGIGYGGARFEALYFEHAVTRGIFAVTSFLITLCSLVVGVVYSIAKKDVGTGFTVAAYGAIPLAIVVALWTKV
jgi:hypothetical protein